jgi:MFS family permease
MCATIAQAVMNLLMTATPIAMLHAHHVFSSTAFVIQWHVFFMFAPGFFTGSLIDRFGPVAIIVTGLILQLVSALIGISGHEVMFFWAALALLGLGWNFAFTGATTLLTEVHTPAERAKTQGANNFLIYSTVAVASFMSGTIVHHFGWFWVNVGALPFLIVAFGAAYWLHLQRRAERQGKERVQPAG